MLAPTLPVPGYAPFNDAHPQGRDPRSRGGGVRVSRATIAIVGGGVAGTLTAMQLLRASASVRVVLINQDATIGRGVAYSTSSRSHLLNVPAARMSAFPDDPDHFLRWARMRLGPATPNDAFLPRQLYGEYVAELLRPSMRACAARRDARRSRLGGRY